MHRSWRQLCNAFCAVTKTSRRIRQFATRDCPRLATPSPSLGLLRAQLPLPLFLAAEPGIGANRDRTQFALQLLPARIALARQLAGRQRPLHRAPGLRAVGAIVEAA